MSIHSGYMRDQIRVLSEIAPNFGRFSLRYFRGRAYQKLYLRYHTCLAVRRLEKIREDTLTSPEVIGVNTLNFKPNFKCSRLYFVSGPPCPFWCTLASLGQSLARVKFRGGRTP